MRCIVIDDAFFQKCILKGMLNELGCSVIGDYLIEDCNTIELDGIDVAFISSVNDTNVFPLARSLKTKNETLCIVMCYLENHKVELPAIKDAMYDLALEQPYTKEKVSKVIKLCEERFLAKAKEEKEKDI